MTVLNISECARLAGVSRNTIYEKINAGELSRTAEGIDTSELIRVFPDLKSYEDVRIKEVKKMSDRAEEGRAVASGTDAHTEHLAEQVVWLREMLEKREQQIEERDRQLAEHLEMLQKKDEFWANQVKAVQALLPAPTDQPIRRKKLLGIF